MHTSEFLACEIIHLLLQMKHVEIVRRVSFEELDEDVTIKIDDPVAEARRQMLDGNLEQALAVVDSASREVQAASRANASIRPGTRFPKDAMGTTGGPGKCQPTLE